MPRLAFVGGRGWQDGRGVAGLQGSVSVPGDGRPAFGISVVVAVRVGQGEGVGRVGINGREKHIAGHGVVVGGHFFREGDAVGVVIITAGPAVAVA